MSVKKEIIRNLNSMSNYQTIEELETAIKDYIERYIGHVVNSLEEGDEYLSEIMPDCQDATRFGDYQTAEFDLDNESAHVWVKIEEIMKDSGADDYCYRVTVEEA